MDLNGVQGIEADLVSHSSLHDAAEGVDTFYSMASPMPGRDSEFEGLNSEGVENLLEVGREIGIKTLVHLSCIDVYGFDVGDVDEGIQPRPAQGYQRSKLDADRILQEFADRNRSPRIVIIRAARGLGSRDGTLATPLLRMMESGKVVLPKGGEMSFTHPRDMAQAMYRAATNPAVPGGVYLVKSFDSTILDVAAELAKASDLPSSIRHKGLMSRSPLPPYTQEQLEASLRLKPQQSWKTLGYSPEYDLSSVCGEIASWYKREPWVTEET